MLLEKFEKHIRETGILPPEGLLLAFSGGLDSVVLADLLYCLGYQPALGHINFGLRAEESAGDATFAASFADLYGLPFHTTAFDTLACLQAGESVQMGARRLRYDWLEALRQREGYSCILTAHQANDNLETMVMRFMQSTGLSGIGGIPPRSGVVLRPLLPFSREEIADYAQSRGLSWREDSSNAKTDYLRNRIRHQLLPLMQTFSPGLLRIATDNARRFREAGALYAWSVEHFRAKCVQEAAGQIVIDRVQLLAAPAPLSLLHAWLQPLGFTAEQCRQAATARPGSLLRSSTHSLLIKNEEVCVRPLAAVAANIELYALSGVFQLDEQAWLRLSQPATVPPVAGQRRLAAVDLSRLQLPLRLRHWKPGDWFCPAGMGGKKQKLQDFFTNSKIDRQQRESVWLLVDDKDAIVWVVGHRQDERFKAQDSSRDLLFIEYLYQLNE
jgi:tRNA(Ile)-lysidine synthase